MKKWIITGLLLTTLPVMAQQGSQKQMHKNPDRALNTEQRATLKSKEMALMLDLNASQLNQVQKTLEAHFETGKALRESRSDEGDESRFELRNARLDHQLALQQDMQQILNEEQYALWKKVRMRQHRQKGERRQHMRRGRRGPGNR